MGLRDRLILSRQLGRALAAVGRDAIADRFGEALPLDSEPLLKPEVLAGLLSDVAFDGLPGAPPAPARVDRLDQEAPSSNCQNSVLSLEWGEATDSAAWPQTVFVKQPSADLAIRVFANVIGFWQIECSVCRHLSHHLPIDTPKVYSVRERRSRFVLIMENLLDRPDVSLFVNRDLLAGAPLDIAARALETLAELHAGFADWDEHAREEALPVALHPFRSPTLMPVLLAVNRLAAAPCHRRAPQVFDADCRALYERALAAWPALEKAWYAQPLTLVHGDSHLGNFYRSGDRLGMLDFQGAHWSRGIRDVQYFLINSMPSEVLARHERALVTHYAAASSRFGLHLDADEAFEEYRAFSFQTLMTAVVSMGLGSFSDSDEVVAAMLERAVTAARRLDFEGWLAGIESTGRG